MTGVEQGIAVFLCSLILSPSFGIIPTDGTHMYTCSPGFLLMSRSLHKLLWWLYADLPHIKRACLKLNT